MMHYKFPVSSKVFLLALLAVSPAQAKESEKSREEKPVLWQEPVKIDKRDLFHGIGGSERAPTTGPFTFEKEDLDGNSPKFVVTDGNGTKWKVKVGPEARPETVVTRFVWAVGYLTDEDYFVPSQRVEKLPRRLKRGREFVSSDGIVRDARWERMDRDKIGKWKWRKNPHSRTRELNGLRVLMAMFNNYDMKDSQNSLYKGPDGVRMVVSDLGATLGPTRTRWPLPTGRGELDAYQKTKFITNVHKNKVDFAAPAWPTLFGFLPLPPLPYTFFSYPLVLVGGRPAANLTAQWWIGRGIPRDDARWIGSLLARLTPAQITDAFRSAHYSPKEVEGFSREIRERIAALGAL